jgi:hypothetical protein
MLAIRALMALMAHTSPRIRPPLLTHNTLFMQWSDRAIRSFRGVAKPNSVHPCRASSGTPAALLKGSGIQMIKATGPTGNPGEERSGGTCGFRGVAAPNPVHPSRGSSGT